jgi:hypothetical protein
MLGGMSGGGMGFIFAPEKKPAAQKRLQEIMSTTKRDLEHALPFAMEPVVYDFAINEKGTSSELLQHQRCLMPFQYYTLIVPDLLRRDRHSLSRLRRAELDRFAGACRTRPELGGVVQNLFDVMLPASQEASGKDSLSALLNEHGFDRLQHEQIRADLRSGRIGLAQNRLPASAVIEDVRPEDVLEYSGNVNRRGQEAPATPKERPRYDKQSQVNSAAATTGLTALREGQAAVITLAAGAGSRWTQGAGVVKALHPFCKLAGRHRTFVETHLAKSRRTSRQVGTTVPHIFTTGYLTHKPIEEFLARNNQYGYEGPLFLSPGKSVGLRMIPATRDLRFLWQEMPQQILDEQQQKVRDSFRQALMDWARNSGEAMDYVDNVPLQCLHPVGHWYEIPNLFRNGLLRRLLEERPQLKYPSSTTSTRLAPVSIPRCSASIFKAVPVSPSK